MTDNDPADQLTLARPGALPIVVASIMRPLGTTGVQTSFKQFGAQLKVRGVNTELITSFSSPSALRFPLFAPRKLLDPINGSAGVWWYLKWHRAMLARALRHRLANGAPAIIYAQSPTAAEAALRARHGAQQRIILAVHFGESVARGWIRRGVIPIGGRVDTGIRSRERRTIPRLDGLVHVSADGRRELLEQIPDAADVPFEIIPNFVPKPPLSDIEPRRDAVNLGTLEPRKNQAYLIEVVAAARGLGRDVTLTIVGDGPDRASLEVRAKARGVADLIDFAGFVADGARLISDHRLYVHSSTYESLSLAVIEGLAHGRPVVVAEVGGLPELISDGVEGRFWPLDSPRQAAEMLIEILDDPSMYDRMAAAARARFESHFDAEVVIPRLYNFLQEVGAAANV